MLTVPLHVRTSAATNLNSASFDSVHLVLAPTEYEAIATRLAALLTQLLAALQPLGTLHVHNVEQSSTIVSSAVTLSGFTLLTTTPRLWRTHRPKAGCPAILCCSHAAPSQDRPCAQGVQDGTVDA